MKYRAFIDFTHNGVKIKGGEVFDSDEVKFSIADINFLKEQSKIELARPLIKLNQNSINEDIVKPEEIPVETKEIIKETMVQDESPDLKEEIAEEVIVDTSKEDVVAKVKELDLTKLYKSQLVELAEELGIDSDGKTKKELIAEISLLIDQLE